MAIVFAYRGSVYSTTAGANYTASPTWTPAANSLLLSFHVGSLASSPTVPNGVSGHGGAYTQITGLTDEIIGGTHRISAFVRLAGASPTSAACVAGYGSNRTGGVVIEYEITGADVSGTAIQAIIQAVTATGTGTSGSISLAAAAHANNRAIAFFLHLANEGTTPRTNWTEEAGADGNFGSPATGAGSQYRADTFETTASASWATSSEWVGVALEIKADAVTPAVSFTAGATADFGGKVVTAGAASFTGASTSSFVPRRTVFSSVVFSGAATAAYNATKRTVTAASFSTAATESFAAIKTAVGAASFTGVAAFSAVADKGSYASVSFSTESEISLVSASPDKFGRVSFTGVGVAAFAGKIRAKGISAFTGVATVGLAAAKRTVSQASFTGAAAFNPTGSRITPASVSFVGEGSLAAVARASHSASMSFSTSLAFDAVARRTTTSAVQFVGVGSLQWVAQAIDYQVVSYEVTATLSSRYLLESI